MNRIFRIIWSRALHTWVVASELTRRRGKGGRPINQRTARTDVSVSHATEPLSLAQAWPLWLGILAALTALYAPAHAADRYWDPNGTAINWGGSGTWNTTDPFWSPNSDGVSGPFSPWNNVALDDAFFGGTTGTVTLGSPTTVHNLTFLSNGYTLTGSTLTLAGATPTINTGNGAVTQTINSIIAGSDGLTKAGTGTLALNGVNTFSGGISINAGALSVNGNAALGDASNTITMAAGTGLAAGTGNGGDLANRTVNLVGLGGHTISGDGVGSAFYTGEGNLTANGSVAMNNNANDYAGSTAFGGSGTASFTSIGNLGEVSSLGAPTTVANGLVTFGNASQTNLTLVYVGDGDTSNRNWQINPGSGPGGPRPQLRNGGTGTLILTGNITLGGGSGNGPQFYAESADLELLGVISSNNARPVSFIADAGRTVTLGNANTFTGVSAISGAGQVQVGTIADSGIASSLGAGTQTNISGTLSYTGTGASSNRDWSFNNGTLSNDGNGALTLSGGMALSNTGSLGGSFTGTDNVYSGVISGTGNLQSVGDTTWLLTGANTYTGSTIVNGGVLRAGAATAFGASDTFVVDGGILGLSSFDQTIARLTGTGGVVELGSATLTVEAGEGVSASYGGSIAGIGGLTKLGASTQTLVGASTYAGDTTIGGGTLRLDFSGAGGPINDIISSTSTLDMTGGTLNVIGATGEGNTQTFDGLNVTAGNNTIGASSGTGGSLTVNLGAITRTGGLMNFDLPGSGSITTSNADMFLAWATVNGTDYAKVEGGNILAFVEADYTDKDNAANWLDNEFITDVNGFFGTVSGSKQLGGLRYTRPVSTTVTVAPGETLGVDAPIIVAPSVGGANELITGGMITGGSGSGDALIIQQNGTGNFTIASQIVDNGNNLGFTKAGTGLVTLTNANNSYTGATQILEGTLSVNNIGNGGVASGIGASSADSSNLVLEGSTLQYTGGTTNSDRGFTLVKSGDILGSEVAVTNAGTDLTFSGVVTSTDGAGLTKSGPGTLTLANGANDYTGTTTVTGGLLSVNTLADGGLVSGIGASSADAANLVLAVNAGLQYTGSTTSTDHGFTMGASPNVNSGSIIDVTDAGTILTVSGTVDDSKGRLIKEGDGTLVLSGTTNYGRGNLVNEGVLRAGGENTFGPTNVVPWNTTLADAIGVTLDLNNFDNMIGGLVGGGANGGNVTLGSGTLRIAGDGGDYSGVINGTGGILRTNGGTQAFKGCNNTYTGATTLQGANLSVDCLADGGLASGIGASSSASNNLVFNNGSLEYTGGSVSVDRGFQLLGNGGINLINAGTTLEFEGAVIGTGTLIKRNAGALVLSGANTYTAGTVVEGGVLRAGVINAFGPSGNMTLNNTAGVLLDLDDFDTAVTSLAGGGVNGGNVNLGSATLTILSGSNQTYSGVISGSGNLVKNGGGNQRLGSCNSTYTGTTTVNAGLLSVDCLADGGVNSSIGASTSDPANLVLNGGTLNYVGNGGSTNRQFTLGGSASIASAGSGAIEFSYTGPVALTGTNTARTLTLTGTNAGDNIFSVQLHDNGTGATSLTKTGDGLWRLTANSSTYTGVTTISGGILSVDNLADGGVASSIGASSIGASNLVIGNGSTLRYTGTGDSTDRLFTLDTGVTFIESSGTGALQFTNTDAITLTSTNTARTIALGGTNTGDNTMGGAIGDNGTGATTLAKNDSGTWILTGNNTYSGNTVINDGNLMIGDGGTTGNAGVGNVIVDSPTSTLSLNRSDTFTFDGALSGPGTLAQIGTGTSVLTSTDNSIGATTIENGTLQVDGGLETPTVDMAGTSALTVNGTAQADSPTPTVLSGDAGDQTIAVNAGGTLLASGDLGDGNDIVDLVGTLDTGTGTLALGEGDDALILNDGAQMLGSGVNASGGGGTDNLTVNTVLGFVLDGGAIDTFNILTKQNSGELTLTGNQDFDTSTNIEAGSMNVDGFLTTPTLSMADDTTLNVDGQVGGIEPDFIATMTGSSGAQAINVDSNAALAAAGDLGDGADTVTLAGLLNTGGGTLGLGDGDDTLTLRDVVVVAGGGVDAGAGGNDTLILDNANALTFDGGQTAGFELLQKDNVGDATITGSQSFDGGTALNEGTLTIAGDIETPTVDVGDGTTLNVDGTLETSLGSPVTITGSAGDNTVTVGADGLLVATGSLGDGNDVLDVAGTLDTGGFVFDLGDGDDTLTVHDNTDIVGTVDAGAGNNTLDTHIDIVADLGAVQGFQILSKAGTGELNINGPLSSDFNTVNVLAGTLDVTAGGSVVGSPGIPLTTTVAAGATLNVDGNYGCSAGDDTMTVAGTVSGTRTIDLCGGDDVLTLQDGAVLDNAISGGAGTGDTLVLDNAGALTFDAGNTTNFELLQKGSTGTATLTGTQEFIGGIMIDGGTLTLDGTVATPTADMADDTQLHVDGFLGSGLVDPTIITGSAGTNIVKVGPAGTLLANGDLGAGQDTLDVSGTLDTGGGTFALGDGDDNFVVHDNTVVLGAVDGGAGLDTRTYDINTTADLGVLVNFEGVTKTGTGVLNINGPDTTDLQEVSVLGGTLNIGPDAGMVAIAGGPLDTVVAAGATLNVDGSFGCGDGADTMTVAGTVSGSGTIDLCGGDDTLTLQDGAVLAATISGGGHGAGDTVVLDNASAMTLDASHTTNFEFLRKDNAGEATLTGMQIFSGGTTLDDGTLAVAGVLQTPVLAMADDTTLNVDSQLAAGPGAATAITGSAGVNTINVTAGALLAATGDLGDGDDVLSMAGTLDTVGGTFSLGAGDDTFRVFDITNTAVATIDGGAGNDTLDVNVGTGNTVPLGSLLGFESLGKSGQGTLEIQGPSGFIDVGVHGGRLRVTDAGSINATNTVIDAGSTLELVDGGSYAGTSGADTFTVAGTVLGTGTGTDTIDLGDGDDTFTIQDGADLSGLAKPVDGGAGTDTLVAEIAGTATLGGVTQFETLNKTNTGTLVVAGPAPSDFTTVNVDGGTLDVGAAGSLSGVVTTTVAGGATLNVNGSYAGSTGDDTMDVSGVLTGTGPIAFGDGDDTLTLHDGANLSGFTGTLDGGAHGGGDTAVLDTTQAMSFGAGPVVNFEFLSKTGSGTATLLGNQGYSGGTTIAGGTLAVAGTLVTPSVAMADDTTLSVAGMLDASGGAAAGLIGSAGGNTVTVGESGTLVANGDLGAGDDRFTSQGTVRGAFAFGAGDDSVDFLGGDPGGVTALDGGIGTDRLGFGGLTLASATLPALAGWERMELHDGSALTLDAPLDLGGGTLAIDASSQLIAPAAATVAGSVENAGAIDVGSHRLAIGGDYVGQGGTLHLNVTPATLASGGLDIRGDVRGTTALAFDSDGSKVSGAGEASILVIASPNDDPATDGDFVAADTVDGAVRLEGSLFPWSFGQEADHNWYLKAQAGLLPELPAYAVLPMLGTLLAQQEDDVVHQRLAGARGTERPQCGQHNDPSTAQAGLNLLDDCHGFWVAASGSGADLGANPGFAASGSHMGLTMGLDYAAENAGQTVRIGAYLGYLHGNYWTTGVNSTALPGIGEAGVRLDTPVGGWYGSLHWSNGAYAEAVVSGERNRARVRTSDGFTQELTGGNVTVSAKAGRRYELDNGWSLEPQVRWIASDVTWHDLVDGNGRSLAFAHGWVNTGRAGLRMEKTFITTGGATIKPWATVAVQRTFGQPADSLAVAEPGASGAGLVLPNQDLGISARLDAGVEARLGKRVSLFGVLSASHSLNGSSYREQAANLGVRVRW